jgi:FKBP-type peptidyl-prolyl cis-trans isomerase FklB
MQKLLIVLFCFVSTAAFAQGTAKKPAATARKPVAKPSPAALKNQADSFSYAIGVSIANFYREQGITGINSSLVTKALTDCKNGKPALDDGQVNSIIMAYMQQKRSEKSAGTRKAGEAFLAENKNKPGVVTTSSGLQYMILKEGNGPKPTAADQVKVHYHGTLIDGTVFDSSVQRGEPIVFPLSNVIPGWVEAIQLMPVGSKWRLFVPSNLAYGDNDAGPVIKAGSTLIFDVELLEIVAK